MNQSTFSRVMTVGFLFAVIYVGHGLHTNDPLEFPELTAHAVAGNVTAVSVNNEHVRIITTNEDGSVIRVWASSSGHRTAEFIGEYSAPSQ